MPSPTRLAGTPPGSTRQRTTPVSAQRRVVRATPGFFEDLDRQLPSSRGPNGEPGVGDFQAFELLRIVDRFAERLDELPAVVPGREDYRLLVIGGVLFPALAVVGQQPPVAVDP